MNKLLICCVVALLLAQCKTQSVQKAEMEAFEEFRAEFYQDSSFQVERIEFPLEGVNTRNMDLEGGQTKYLYHAGNWQMLHQPDTASTRLRHEIEVEDSTAMEKFYLPNSGFLIQLHFKRNKGKWYLSRFIDSNL